MKIEISRDRFLTGIKKVSAGANAKTTMPILANVKLVAAHGKLAMTTTTLTMTLCTEIDCKVVDEGSTTVPLRMLSSILSAMVEGDVVMEQKENKVRISCSNYVTQVGTIPADQFPTIANPDAECTFKLAAKDVRDLLRKTSYAQYQNEDRRMLNGVLFEFTEGEVRCVATDGRRLAVAQVNGSYECKDKKRYIIPAATVFNVQRLIAGDGDVVLECSKDQIRFILDNGADKVIAQLVDGEYPNYLQVIPNGNDKIVEVEREALIGAVERVSVMATRPESSIKMTIADNHMLVEVKGDDLCDAHDEIPVKYVGEKVEIIFNPRYLLDYFKASDSDMVKMEFMDGGTPAKFKGNAENYLGVLMPLRVANI